MIESKVLQIIIWKGPYYMFTMCHRSFSWCSVRNVSIKNCNSSKLDYMSAAIFDNRLHICLTCHERVSKGKIPFQEVCHQLEVEVSPKILQDLRRLEKGLISRGILFKKKVMMFSKGEFSKIKRNICNVLIDIESIWNVLPRPVHNNRLIIVKLKCHLRYRGHVYFEPVRLESIYAALSYLKNSKFYEDIIYGLSSSEILHVADASLAHEQSCNSHQDTKLKNKLNLELLDDPLN